MGCYVNPKQEDKETWLENNATTICKMNFFSKMGNHFCNKRKTCSAY